MATRIVGNNHRGTHHTWNDVDNGDANAILWYEEVMPFSPYVLAFPLYGSITAYYYKYHDDIGVEDSYPALYADNNGQPGEKLTKDEPLMRTSWWTGDTEGWVQAIVPMRRTVAVGEKVWFGFFGYMIAPRYDINSVQTVWLSEWDYNIDVGSPPTESIASPYKDYRPPMRLSMYFSYSDVSPSVNYVRRVSDIARGTGRLKHSRLKYKRFAKKCTIGGSDNTQRVQTLVRKCTALCSVVDFLTRRHMLFRNMTSLASIVSKLSSSKGFLRYCVSLCCCSDFICNTRELLRKTASLASGFTGTSNSRELLQKIASRASGFTAISTSRELLLKVISRANGFTGLSNKRELLLKLISRVDGSSKLSTSRELLQMITSLASGFAKFSYLHGVGVFVQTCVMAFDSTKTGMCIRRVVFTVCGLWERLLGRKGVHRVEIVLYSPITLELKLGKTKGVLEMKKIFTHQTALRITIQCGVDLSGNVKAEIQALKPNGGIAVFSAVILDAEKGIIAYDVMDTTTLDVDGWWKFCSFVTFADGRSAQGVPILVFVYEGLGGLNASKTK